MINLPAIFIANGSAAMLMIIVLISQRKTTRYGLLDEKLYYTMLMLTVLQCFVESATFFVDGKDLPGYRWLNLALNAFLFSMNIVFSLVWTIFADFKIFESTERLKKIYPWVAIPAVTVAALCVANIFVPIFYSVSPDNVYSREKFFVIPYLVTYFYLAYGVVIIYAFRKKASKYLFLPAITFMIPILVGSVIQFVFYGISLIWMGTAIGMVSLYVNVQNEASYIDPLSGLFSRQYLRNYLTLQFQKPREEDKLAGIMIDIDQFKSINDNFGHLVGDSAITDVGQILREVVKDDGLVSRYAGDEFVIVRLVKDESEIQKLVDNIRQKTEDFNKQKKRPYELKFSMGCSLYEGRHDTTDAFFKRMDDAMYKEKRSRIENNIIHDRRI